MAKDENEDTFEIRKLKPMSSHMYMYMYMVTVTCTLEVYDSDECNNTHPIVLRHLISFSIRVADEVGIRCFNATFEDGRSLAQAKYTELNVPVKKQINS